MISHYFWFEGEKERRNNVSNPSFGTAGAVHAYATQHAGCQTRMVLGQSCWSHEPLNHSELKAAQRRLEQFAFVGITDRYDESVCLFHAMAGGSRGPVAVEFEDVRRDAAAHTHNTSHLLTGLKDPYDGPLYEKAVAIFERNLAGSDAKRGDQSSPEPDAR